MTFDSAVQKLVTNFSSTSTKLDFKEDFRVFPATKEALLAIGDGVQYPEKSATRNECAEWWKKMGPIFASVMAGWSGQVPEEIEGAIEKEDLTVNGASVRVLKKKGVENVPTLVYLHGGGFAVWSCKDTAYDNYLSRLAALGKCVIIAVDYTSATDAPFPAGLNDCVTVCKAAIAGSIAGVTKGKICIAGDSSGGNLAASCTLTAQQEGWQEDIMGIYTVCPYFDGKIKDSKYPSMMEFDGYFATAGFLTAVVNGVVEDGDREAWSTNPMLYSIYASPDSLKTFPPTKTVVMELDMIRDMGLAFHYKLLQAGGNSTMAIVGGGVHEQQLFTLHSPETTVSSIHDLAQFVNYVANL